MAEQQGPVVAQDQLLAQLRTRGFTTGTFTTPLKHFRGTLTSISGNMEQFGKMQKPSLLVHYNFVSGDLEVIESSEPYLAPVAQIDIWHSASATSAFGVLGKSIDKIINAGMDENLPQDKVRNHDFLIGKKQEWKVTPGHSIYNSNQKMVTPTDSWEVMWVDMAPVPLPGVTAPSRVAPMQQAINLLDDRTQQQWNNVVFQDPVVKSGGGELVNLIINGTLLKTAEDSGLVTKDANGVYHVVRKD